jgi:hypothetical protein
MSKQQDTGNVGYNLAYLKSQVRQAANNTWQGIPIYFQDEVDQQKAAASAEAADQAVREFAAKLIEKSTPVTYQDDNGFGIAVPMAYVRDALGQFLGKGKDK